MFLFQVFPVLLLCGHVYSGVASKSNRTHPISADIVPVTFVGNVAPIQAPAFWTGALQGDTRIYYQNADGGIQATGISGPLTSGTFIFTQALVPASQVQGNTPIAAVTINEAAFQAVRFRVHLAHIGMQVHVFFVSPSNILSEYIFSEATGWRGGPSCTDCIDVQGFVVQSGNRVLYAMANEEAGSLALLRVGFVSAGAPDTLSEADFDAQNGWRLAQMIG
ncbi:hypothetical protein GGX14DRAFT_574960 [Mycena pura]|uniref:Uncharacterized protein n=1 Tax=Mycena pura TaxID=153505 RepID=A0AAD6UWW1_9AGAR|nr:hypothetical protein GGX14DRAFT_574960 [Mycena pura]